MPWPNPRLVRCTDCPTRLTEDCDVCGNSGFILEPTLPPAIVELWDAETGAYRQFVSPPEFVETPIVGARVLVSEVLA